MSPQVSFVRAAPRQSAQLSRIARESKAHWGYPGAWMGAWRDELTLSPEFIRHNPVYVALLGREPAGLFALSIAAPLSELEHFWVLPAFMGRGVGRRMFAYAAHMAFEMGAQSLHILADPNAAGFYRHMGARSVGESSYWLDGETRVLPRLRFDLQGAFREAPPGGQQQAERGGQG